MNEHRAEMHASRLRRAIATLGSLGEDVAPRWKWPVAIALLGAAFAADYFTGSEVASSLYYLVAIAFAAWLLGRVAGVVMAALGGLGWFAAYLLVGQAFSKTSVLLWNLFVEVAMYTGMALVLGALRDHVAQIRLLAERLRLLNGALERETSAVGRLQRDLLPDGPPGLTGYEWSLHYETSTRSSGDYYDFVGFADGRIGVLIADASGHGAPAAVLMAMTRTLVHVVATEALTPDRVLSRLSLTLSRLIPAGSFVTACYLILEPESGRFEYSLAGHDPPLVVRAAERCVERLRDAGGPPLGAFPTMPFATARGRLADGDALVLHTDGLTEALDASGRLLGEEAVSKRSRRRADSKPMRSASDCSLASRHTARGRLRRTT